MIMILPGNSMNYNVFIHLKKALFVLLAFLISFQILGQTEKRISLPIKSVTVFRSQAQIIRNDKINLEAGNYMLVIDKVSPNLIQNSIEAKAQTGISILSVSTKNDFLVPNEKPAFIQSLEDSMEVLSDHLADFKADKESILLQKELLLANKNLGGSTQGVKAEELEDVLGIYQKKLNEFKVEWFKLSKEEKVYGGNLEQLKKQLDEYNQGTLNLSNQILVFVKVDRQVLDANFELRYLVGGVSWQPFYDIRVQDTKSPVQFFLKANIQQSTGEFWGNVKLKLTTADPMESGVKPVLRTNFLRFVEPMGYPVEKKSNFSNDGAMAPQALMATSRSLNEVQVIQNMINTEFDVSTLHTIPSDNKIHQVELTNFSQPAVYSHSVVPKLDKDVFVIAQVSANDLINQISGEANVFFDGTFTGKTYINSTVNDTLLLTLGRDKRILVERVRKVELSSKSFFGSNRKETSTYEITVKNTGSESIEIAVEDQVPVSTDKDIQCSVLEKGDANYDVESGFLKWRIKLGPQQIEKIRFSFEITYPCNKKITSPY